MFKGLNRLVNNGTNLLIVCSLLVLAFTIITPIIEAPVSEEVKTESNVTVQESVAIGISANMTVGILFGTLVVNTDNNNATGNLNGTVAPDTGNETQYWVEIESGSNTNVNLCVGANQNLTNGGYTIPSYNYTYTNSSTNNVTLPSYAASDHKLLPGGSFHTSAENLAEGFHYYRFFLDIPNDQAAGTYSNCVSFKATGVSTACSTGTPSGGC